MKPLTKIAPGLSGMHRQRAIDKADATLAAERLATADANPSSLVSLEALKAELGIKPTSVAVLKSRAKNPEKYQTYQREYMRKRRAAKRGK